MQPDAIILSLIPSIYSIKKLLCLCSTAYNRTVLYLYVNWGEMDPQLKQKRFLVRLLIQDQWLLLFFLTKALFGFQS